ncbi:Ankyrin repeat protein [Giardia duodenalis assemblage B]|uniref:Ankyrin repeat protein n=1 Tax=Giardia duodenalis assemblage B TaxID=1394984 RepID=A0A132NMH4_GIAIN|nr:Ankyrin repeat protein [Giardia intestinalis assemblage B]
MMRPGGEDTSAGRGPRLGDDTGADPATSAAVSRGRSERSSSARREGRVTVRRCKRYNTQIPDGCIEDHAALKRAVAKAITR